MYEVDEGGRGWLGRVSSGEEEAGSQGERPGHASRCPSGLRASGPPAAGVGDVFTVGGGGGWGTFAAGRRTPGAEVSIGAALVVVELKWPWPVRVLLLPALATGTQRLHRQRRGLPGHVRSGEELGRRVLRSAFGATLVARQVMDPRIEETCVARAKET